MEGSIAVLTFASFICAGISAVVGAAGGAILLGIMQWYMTPLEVLPIHSAIQWASNGSRALLSLKETQWRCVWQFVAGSVIGTSCGAVCLSHISPNNIPMFVGAMILTTTLAPKSSFSLAIPGRYVFVGLIQGTVGMLTGAAGPLATAALQRDGLSREQIVITSAMMMALLNTLKMITFVALGYSLTRHGSLLVLTLVASLVGTWAGTQLRGRISEETFQSMLKILLIGLGIDLIAR